MQSLFGVQPFGMPSFDTFDNQLTRAQLLWSFAQLLDTGSKPSADSYLRRFTPAAHSYLKPPQRSQRAMDIASNTIGTFQMYNKGAAGPAENVGKIVKAGKTGSWQAKGAIQMVRAAMAIASRASEAQLKRTGIMPERTAQGVFSKAFRQYDTMPVADRILTKFNRFMDDKQVRESLINYAQAAKDGGYQDTILEHSHMQVQQPGANLAEEVAAIADVRDRNKHIRRVVADGLRFQRLMPQYGHMAGAAVQQIQRVHEQHRRANGFKGGDRFSS